MSKRTPSQARAFDTSQARAFDTALAALYGDYDALVRTAGRLLDEAHELAGDKRDTWRRGQPWGLSSAEVTEKLNDLASGPRTDINSPRTLTRLKPSELLTAMANADQAAHAVRQEINEQEAIWRADPWPRYILCLSPGGHVHNYAGCSTLRHDTPVAWHPELSGLPAGEAVKDPAEGGLGPILCSTCYPDAPLGYRREPADVARERTAGERAGRQAARDAARYVKALTPDECFTVEGYWTERVETVAACLAVIRREVEKRNSWHPGPDGPVRKPDGDHAAYAEGAKRAAAILLARDAAHGGMTQAQIDTVIARAEKRNA
jgi:hypothetical protein